MNTLKEKFDKAVEEYMRRLSYNNLSPCTMRNYMSVLNSFSLFLDGRDENSDLYEVVEDWRDSMMDGGSQPSTVRQKLTTLKIFFDKTTKRSFPKELRFEENPVDEDFKPKVTKKPYDNLLDDSDLIKLWKNEPPTPRCKPTWARNYAIVCLILGTGLRNSEVRSLRLSDVSWEDETITVVSGKGDKYRIVDAPAIVLESITAYLNSGMRPAYLSGDDYLFGNTSAQEYGKFGNSGKVADWHPFSVEGLSKLIERHVQNVCGDDSLQIRCHDLRHLFARIHLNVNGNISELQSALGHSSPEISQIYAGRVAPRRARDSARAVIAARDAAAEKLKKQNAAEQKVIPLFA